MDEDTSVGQRIARYRRRRGLTVKQPQDQEVFCARVSVTSPAWMLDEKLSSSSQTLMHRVGAGVGHPLTSGPPWSTC